MRLVILGGFLGSGKTSVLIPLAKAMAGKTENGLKKTKVAIIENEIGTVGIDSAFTKGTGFASRELFGGCVCCSVVGGLLETLCEIEKNEDPEWVVLEATGLAWPDDIAENVWEYYDENMNITVISLVDASRWKKLAFVAGDLVFGQVKHANYVIINKTDLTDENELKSVRYEIEHISEGMIYAVSSVKEPEGVEAICTDIVDEIMSWE